MNKPRRCVSARMVEPLEPRALLAAPHQVDLAVFYTPAAVSALGAGATDAQIIERIVADVADANAAFANSQVDVALRLVSTQRVDYTEAALMSTDLDRLRRTDDGILDEVHTARAAAGADLVALYRARGGAILSGISYDLTDPSAVLPDAVTGKAPAAAFAFSVVAAGERWALAHEIGHSFGAGHDKVTDPDGGMTPFASGYRYDDGVIRFRTVMAYGPEPVVPYFSNPAVTYEGVPVGVADDADNARAMNLVASAVAAYYTAPPVEPPPVDPPPVEPPPSTPVVADTAPPRAKLSAATLRRASAKPYRFKVTFTDASAIGRRSVRNALLLLGPHKFRQTARLISLKASAAGTTLTALYEVRPPGETWGRADNGVYSINVRPRTILDALGNNMPARKVGVFKVAIGKGHH